MKRAASLLLCVLFLAASSVCMAEETKQAAPLTPDFVPVSEDISPLRTIVSVSGNSRPLKDVLYSITEAVGLNVVMEAGVNPDLPVTASLREMPAEDALRILLNSVDYFYSIEENILTVKAADTVIFELGHPAIIQSYSTDIGGDMLGGVAASSGGTASNSGSSGNAGGSSSGSAGSGLSSLKGNITQSLKSDQTAFGFWDAVEKSIANILKTADVNKETGKITQEMRTTTNTSQSSFTVNRLTGTIVVTAAKKDIEKVRQYINTVKKAMNRQVLVEARVIEVQLSEGLKYGIDWSTLDFNGLGRVTVDTSKFGDVVGAAGQAFQIGVSRWNFTSLLRAIQDLGEIKTLSNPRLSIMNGHAAILSVGSSISFVTLQSVLATTSTATTTTTGMAATPTVSSVLSGLSIGIVPYISESGEISLTITPMIADVVKFEPQTVNGSQISVPTINIREMSTTVKVKDEQLVVIGGLIQNKETTQDYQVPFVGSIPLIGNLFKSRVKSSEKTELIIMLKPTIVGL